MRFLGLDLETTGLVHGKDRVTEIAWVVKDHGDPKPLAMGSIFVSPPEGAGEEYLTPEIRELTKITMGHLAHGHKLHEIVAGIGHDLARYGVDAVVAHNGENFDKPFLKAALGLEVSGGNGGVFNSPWVDTSVDIVYPKDCRYTNLTYLAAYHGFLNPFPHSALFDVMTMLKIADRYDAAAMLARSKSPWVTIEALVDYGNRQKAKDRRFFWEQIGEKRYPKCWVKRVKSSDLEAEKAACLEAGFDIGVIPT